MEVTVHVVAHMPGLRIDQDVTFGPGWRLWRMPFDQWNAGAQGAFDDRGAAYEAARPTFFNFAMAVDLDVRRDDRSIGAIESKSDDAVAMLGTFGLGKPAHLINVLWRALTIALPQALLPDPGLSQIFVQLDDGFVFNIPNGAPNLLRVQGAADHELLFQAPPSPDSADLDQLKSALDLMLDFDEIVSFPPDIEAALRTLQDSADPTLTDPERLALATVGLEALLLPEIRAGLKRTFAQRIAALLGDEGSRESLQTAGRTIYAQRSGTVHGLSEGRGAHSGTDARVLLAAAIRTMSRAARSGTDLFELREGLDAGRRMAEPVGPIELGEPAAASRLEARSTRPAFHFGDHSLITEEGRVLDWAPLAGLTLEQPLGFGEPGSAPLLIPLSGNEVISLVDKDTARDFAASLRTVSQPVAAIAWEFADRGEPDAELSRRLCRQRNLAVCALRLAGVAGFVDPELFGLAAFRGARRLREPTIYQQSVLLRLKKPAGRIDADSAGALAAAWQLVSNYDQAPHATVEFALTLFRRAFFTDFLPAHAQATLLYACLEAMLGRITRRDDSPSTESMVRSAAGASAPDAVEWFIAEGRRHRNAIAHGAVRAAEDAAENDHLRAILRGVMASYLHAWSGQPRQPEDEPAIVHQLCLTT